jgi:hypothetical protein
VKEETLAHPSPHKQCPLQSPTQLVAGSVRRFQSKSDLFDLDLAGFDWLDIAWMYPVLERKVVWQEVVSRSRRLYAESKTVEVVNNLLGQSFPNNRGSLIQGDVSIMY